MSAPDQGLWFGGSRATHLIASDAAIAEVRLENGGRAYVPSASDAYQWALELPAETPAAVVPVSVTNAQARAALRAAGLLTSSQALIDAHPTPSVRDAWEYSPYIARDSVLVASLGAALGLSSGTIDTLFIAAAAIDF